MCVWLALLFFCMSYPPSSANTRTNLDEKQQPARVHQRLSVTILKILHADDNDDSTAINNADIDHNFILQETDKP